MELKTQLHLGKRRLGTWTPHRSGAIISSCQAVSWGLPALSVVAVPDRAHLAAWSVYCVGGTPLSFALCGHFSVSLFLWGQVFGESPFPGLNGFCSVSCWVLKELAFWPYLAPGFLGSE